MHARHFDRFVCSHGKGDFTLPGAEAHYPPDVEIEPRHIDAAYRLDLAAESAEGTVTHTLRARREGPSCIAFHAVDFGDVSATDPAGRPLTCRYDGRDIRIAWKEPFAADEERQVTIAFRLQSPTTGLYFSRPSEQFPDRAWYAATDNETERARHWLPTVDLPSVRPTLTFHLTAEERFTILGPGLLESEESHEDGTKTAHWRLEQPCPSYLTCFTVGEFVRQDGGEFEGREIAFFTTPYFSAEDLARSFDKTRSMLAWMSTKLDHEFPYPKYFQFALPGYGGAMENISLVSWDDMFVLDETLAREWTWLVDIINVHEMAHSYFGDMIVCRDFAHAWLKESWATYMEQLWLEDVLSPDEGEYFFFDNVSSYVEEADEKYKRPICTRTFNHSWQMYDRHLYPGGASRLHMLRKELGDDTFLAGVREYVKRHAFKTVETSDFRRALEDVSGRSLGKWFDQWIHGKGYPRIKATFAWDEKKSEATFSIEQTQEDKAVGVPVFEMPLDLGWIAGGELHTQTVRLEKAKHVFVVRCTAEPQQVRVDPHNRTVMSIEFDPGAEKLRAQLTGAPDVIGRIRAAQTLAGSGKAQDVSAVQTAYAEETFWGVRVRMAEALAKSGSQAALDALAALIATEQDPLVLEHLFRHAGKHRDAGVVAALEARLDAGLGLYRATQAAYEALGAQRDRAPFHRLTDAAERTDKYGMEQAGAFRALAATRDERAVEILRGKTAPGASSNRARRFATMALGAVGRYVEKHRRPAVGEHLEDLLRDPVDRVRDAAVSALAALGEPAAVPALEAYRERLSAQEGTDVDRAVATLRAAAKSKPGGKDKELEELREKVRKLESRLDKVAARLTAEAESTE